MTTNEALAMYNFISKAKLKDGDAELSKEMKVKIMSMRIELGKIRKSFDEDVKEFADSVIPDELRELASKQDKTEEEEAQFNALNDKVNGEYNAYIIQRGQKEVDVEKSVLTLDEFNELVEVNAGNDVEINGQKIASGDYLEILYSLFVEE